MTINSIFISERYVMNVDLNGEQKTKNYLFFKRCFFKTETIVFKLSVLKTLVFISF